VLIIINKEKEEKEKRERRFYFMAKKNSKNTQWDMEKKNFNIMKLFWDSSL